MLQGVNLNSYNGNGFCTFNSNASSNQSIIKKYVIKHNIIIGINRINHNLSLIDYNLFTIHAFDEFGSILIIDNFLNLNSNYFEFISPNNINNVSIIIIS